MKTEEKAKKVQNIATALAAIFGAVGAFFGIFQAQVSADLKNQVTSLQNASQQTIVNVISTLGDDAQAADLAQSGDTVAITEQLINVYPSPTICRPPRRSGKFYSCRASARTESASRVMCPGSICRFAFWELSKRRSGWPRRRGWFALKGRRNTTGSPQHFTRFYPHVFLASLLTLLCHRPPKCSDKVETDITMQTKMRPVEALCLRQGASLFIAS